MASFYGTGTYGSGFYGDPGAAEHHSKSSITLVRKTTVQVGSHSAISATESEEIAVTAQHKSDVDIARRSSKSIAAPRKDTSGITRPLVL